MTALGEEQAMLRDTARDWAQREAPVAALRRMRDSGRAIGYEPALWQAQCDLGWAGIVVPEHYGGTASGWLALGLVIEQLGRTLVATPLSATSVAAAAIDMGGSNAQKDSWLPKLAAGDIIATAAWHGGSVFSDDGSGIEIHEGMLSGRRTFVPEGDRADLFIVNAPDGLHLVAAGDGVARSSRAVVDSRDHAEILFSNAASEPLGGGRELAAKVGDLAAASASAEMLGLAEAAFEQTNAYLKTRVQFGQPLSTFQALQHRMARMFTELELLRSTVQDAFEALDADRADISVAVSVAKATAGEVAKLVSREMVQLHGGVGMTDEFDAGFFLKRSAVLEQMWGNAAWHRQRYARLSGY